MHAERLNLQTDADGNLEGLPKLPANQRIDAVLLFLEPLAPRPRQRTPPAALKGSVHWRADPFEPSMSDDEVEASTERTMRQIGGDPEVRVARALRTQRLADLDRRRPERTNPTERCQTSDRPRLQGRSIQPIGSLARRGRRGRSRTDT